MSKSRGKGLMLFGQAPKPQPKTCRLAEELRKLASAMPHDLQLVRDTSELYRVMHSMSSLVKLEETFTYKNALRTYKRVTGDAWIEPAAE